MYHLSTPTASKSTAWSTKSCRLNLGLRQVDHHLDLGDARGGRTRETS